MEKHEMHAALFCIHCNEETDHVVTYLNKEIARIECIECRHIIKVNVDLMKEFYREVFEHIVTKPSRMTEEYKKNLSDFLFSLPIRVATKPYRMMHYIKNTKNVMRDFREESDRERKQK
ncbi:MAG TPA: bh protein [Bacillales bacterium]|nr:bh protein [Bacillales bacterium]